LKQHLTALLVEIQKNRSSKITWITFVAFALAPVFGAVFMILMKDGGYDGLSGAFKTKAMMLSFEANWESYLGLLTQAVGIGGVLIFGFAASWLFGREYSDGTARDLLALPISRTAILNAKFAYYIFWCFALVISNLVLALLLGMIIGVPGWSWNLFGENLRLYWNTTYMIVLLNTPVAYMALKGKGYLAPLGLVALLLVSAQIFAVMGFGIYFPWAIPGIYAGSGGPELKAGLNIFSYVVILVTSILGYLATILYWKNSDQMT